MICPLHAWGDESIRSHGLEAPAYLLGASIVDTDEVDATRDPLLELHSGRKKLHWRDLDETRRDRIAAALSATAATHLTVVAEPIALRRQERARAFCLRRMMWELDCLGVVQLTLEARPTELERRDLRLVDALRAQGAVAKTFRVSHGFPDQEAMLWLPDQVLGLVGESLTGDGRRLGMLGAAPTVIHLSGEDLR